MTTKDASQPQDATARDLEDMWRALLSGSWSSLAVVPADHGTNVGLVTGSFQAVSARHGGRLLHLIDAQGASMPQGEALTRTLVAAVKSGARVVVVVDSLMQSLSGVPLLRQSEVVLLVVRVTPSDPDGLRSTIDIVGRERILGSVAVPSNG